LWITVIPEERLHPGRLVYEWQFIRADAVRPYMWYVFWQADGIHPGLLGHPRKSHPLRLGLNHSNGFAVNGEQVIGETGLERELAHDHAPPGCQI
jgi:hypothetical protein